jgi:hypothetical protein
MVVIRARQLRAKFKHAADFGVEGGYNPSSASRYEAALRTHVNAPGTRALSGSYRAQPVTHYLDPVTGLNVIVDTRGEYVSGWRLSRDQLRHVLATGSLGGG